MERLLHLLAVGVLASLGGFYLTDALPGDAAIAALGESATTEQVAALRAELGLDRPWLSRYVDWLSHAVRGDFGTSLRTGVAVGPTVADRLGVSAALMLLTQAIALGLAVPAALASTRRPRGAIDRLVGALSFIALSTPAYVLALGLILLFAITLGWLPASGYPTAGAGALDVLRALLLPALSLALVELPIYLRMLRHELLDLLGQPWARTARAFGASEGSLLLRDVLRAASLPLITLVALNVGHLMAGAVVIESIFALPGMGRLLKDAVLARDLPTVQSCVLIVAAIFVLANLLADGLAAWLDPRSRKAHA
ncbi:MAG: ABC transporter permease [Pseudomonadota bacterium]